MSLYIQQENQNLIWNAIIKTPFFQQWSKTIQDPNISYAWARQIMQQFYLQNQAKQLTVQELQQLNRETIAYMLQNLKQKTQDMSQQSMHNGSFFGQTFSPILDTFPKTKTEQVAVTRDYMLEQKQDEINREFENRQKEYSSMLKRGPVQEIDFRLAAEPDKPIENMEELIRMQMSRREYEIPVIPAPASNKSVNPDVEKSLIKKVHWSNEPVDHLIEASDIMVIKETTETKDTVSAEKQNNILIQQFREFMMEMREEIRVLREELNVIKTQPSPPSSTDNIIFAIE